MMRVVAKGKKNGKPEGPPRPPPGPEPKFRETLWFKKGELDAAEAQNSAGEEDELRPTAVDSLPVEDRYRDDGSVTQADRAAYGVHSGSTEWVRQIDPAPEAGDSSFDTTALVREMGRSRRFYLALVVLGLGGLAAMLVLLF
jgi:hypothetical protein